jgi:hypothetical protein
VGITADHGADEIELNSRKLQTVLFESAAKVNSSEVLRALVLF